MIYYLVVAIVLGCVVGSVAQSMGRKFGDYFLLSLFLSPLIGFIILAIKGKATKEEMLDSTAHIFFCPSCGSTYSGKNVGSTKCPNCNIVTEETTILRDEWRSFSQEKKDQMKELFSKGQYLRNSVIVSNVVPVSDGAEEIKKYKELLDMDAISQEEYDAKKKQILKL